MVGISSVQLFGAANSVASRFSSENHTAVLAAKDTKTSCSSNVPQEAQGIPTQITIAKADIDLPVVSVKLDQGTWAVTDGVGNYALETSRVSNKSGNVGIFGHDRADAFTRIKVLEIGDSITIKTADNKIATYKVTSTTVSDPTNVETFYPTSNPTLTLVTCDGFFSQQRYIVKAQLTSLTQGGCNANTI